MSAHTPGPWAFERERTISAAALPHHNIPLGRVFLADVLSGGVGVEKADANARLIAAAPELYQSLLEYFETDDQGARLQTPRWKRAVEAIRKVKGLE